MISGLGAQSHKQSLQNFQETLKSVQKMYLNNNVTTYFTLSHRAQTLEIFQDRSESGNFWHDSEPHSTSKLNIIILRISKKSYNFVLCTFKIFDFYVMNVVYIKWWLYNPQISIFCLQLVICCFSKHSILWKWNK